MPFFIEFQSGKDDQSTGKLNLKFWHKSGTIECIRSRIKLLVVRDFKGGRSEMAFLKFFFQSALVLEEVVILLPDDPTDRMYRKVVSLRHIERASEASVLWASQSVPQGFVRSVERASDFSLGDPFANYCRIGLHRLGYHHEE